MDQSDRIIVPSEIIDRSYFLTPLVEEESDDLFIRNIGVEQ